MIDISGYSVNTFPGDGGQTNFEISFAGGYISKTHVKGYVVDALGVRLRDVSLAWLGDNVVRVVPAPEYGEYLIVYRDTPKDKPLADFSDGAVLTEQSLDINAKQAVFIAAEASDRAKGDKGDKGDTAIFPVPSISFGGRKSYRPVIDLGNPRAADTLVLDLGVRP